ncbi:MAG: HAMP domain-containing sensor histidine kinase [Clostridiaceae bacterium]|nr:HAMP domain-containing sensor histidine kinase [Clostridiaceae bacterium]
MKNSIQKKLFITYGVVIIIGFGILALTLLRIFNQYFIENRKELLYEQGKKVAREAATVLYLGNPNSRSLADDLQVLDRFLAAHIWVVDSEGTIVAVSGSNEENLLGRQLKSEKLDSLASGDSIEARGNFDGMLSESSLTVGYPVFVNNRFSGGVLVHASLLEIQENFREIYRLTLWAILISVAIEYGILYIQIRRISDPLREISGAAKVIAGGEFHKRLNINTGDEIEELGKSFNNMAESLEKIEENRRNLIANISHDLRSPMTSIRGFIEGMIDGTITEDKREHYLNIVLDESNRLIKITNELLELGNMQQGKLEIKKEAFELNEAIRRKLIAYEKGITEKRLDVVFSMFEEKSFVLSDQVLLERVLSNLMDNAVKFTPEKGSIEIRTSAKEDRVILEITNTGESISSEELNRVWERFHKGDASRGLYKGGYGLGLAIVKEIIIQLDEKIWASSGEGYVKFTFTIKKA